MYMLFGLSELTHTYMDANLALYSWEKIERERGRCKERLIEYMCVCVHFFSFNIFIHNLKNMSRRYLTGTHRINIKEEENDKNLEPK